MPSKKRVRAVIDTNLLLSSVLAKGKPPDKLVKAWLKRAFHLVVSPEQIEELKTVSGRKKFQTYPLFSQRIVELLENIEIVSQTITSISLEKLPLRSRDPKDDFLLAAAVGGKADYLITGDDDLLELHGHPALGDIQILTAREFLDVLKSRS